MSKPTISVIVPVYKVEAYLDRCVSSILNQSLKDFELLLVDDNSPDACPAMCDEYAKQDTRVKVNHLSKNVGLSEARNRGLAAAQGEFISFVDSDDWIENNFLKTLLHKARDTDSDLVACYVHKTTGPSFSGNNSDMEDKVYSTNEALVNIFTSSDEIGHVAWNKLYKKSLFDKGVTYPKGLLHEDILTTYKLLAYAKRICYTKATAYNYFQNTDSITGAKFNAKRLEALDRLDEIETFLKDADQPAREAARYFEYSYIRYFIELLARQPDFANQRQVLLRRLSASRHELWSNAYMNTKDRLIVQAMAYPPLFNMLQLLRFKA